MEAFDAAVEKLLEGTPDPDLVHLVPIFVTLRGHFDDQFS
jgi:hypothetical protein